MRGVQPARAKNMRKGMVAIEVLITRHAFQRAQVRGVECETIEELRELIKSVHKRARIIKTDRRGKEGVYAAKEVVYAAARKGGKLVVKTIFGTLARYNWERSTRDRQFSRHCRGRRKTA
ncbi:hypothetical protein Tfer_2765 [Thermincola ferriacetica]|uniref:Uncharacterized protein n=1 Tax=Thermincola ferriacetica TaxID=281456 RepID=A0A0L6VZU9_9FIRM|nr:hypothetical protein [Thermincola ferriacetica]KNZ68673.1 hypothetical protein Tfer_2765 [Thermincola ferriacetica]